MYGSQSNCALTCPASIPTAHFGRLDCRARGQSLAQGATRTTGSKASQKNRSRRLGTLFFLSSVLSHGLQDAFVPNFCASSVRCSRCLINLSSVKLRRDFYWIVIRPISFIHAALACREAFDLFDTDGSGTIDAKELKVAMRYGNTLLLVSVHGAASGNLC